MQAAWPGVGSEHSWLTSNSWAEGAASATLVSAPSAQPSARIARPSAASAKSLAGVPRCVFAGMLGLIASRDSIACRSTGHPLDFSGCGVYRRVSRGAAGSFIYADRVSRPFGFLLSADPPPRRVGVLAAVLAVALCTLLVYPLKQIAPVVSLGVVYLLAVLVMSATWGAWLGVFTAILSAGAFNFFHLPPVGRFTIRNSSNWVALVAFLVAAGLASSVAEVIRARTREAEERRAEADLAAEMARLLLRGNRLSEALPTAAARLAHAMELSSASIDLEAVEGDERNVTFPLREGTRRLGTLVVPAATGEAGLRRLQERVVPALEALLSAALEREGLQGEVVETAALRRADVVKTAILRAVSHDLRSPLTAISTAGEALALDGLSAKEREELAAVILEETRRLSRLVENLLDLSRLQAGAAEPRRDWTSIEEVIDVALEELAAREGEFALAIDRELPLIRLDPAQLERAFVNVLENARRHSGGHPVSVRARAVRNLTGDAGPGGSDHGRIIVRVVDRGPGIPPAQLERVFEPFYRAGTPKGGQRGSGLGLAIARGFTEANGGTLHVESLPGQGATFVFELPLREAPSAEPADVDPAAAHVDPARVELSRMQTASTETAGTEPARTEPARTEPRHAEPADAGTPTRDTAEGLRRTGADGGRG
jgi:two-component system, OmpR family, sensor histidine kinase KdpD